MWFFFFFLQVLPQSNHCEEAFWFGQGVWSHCPSACHLPRCQQFHQDGGGHWGLPPHRVWVQQVQVSDVILKTLLKAQILSDLDALQKFLFIFFFLNMTNSELLIFPTDIT